ncbi:MAG: alpha/beta fold hydrolase [Candidatus Kapabacteria bacterium]|nr:alpha/beta fold hydrolase [Candidatus Kapabacteria bacterium]
MIIVVHGALGSRHQFEPLLQRLGNNAMFVELPGHGSTSDVDAPWSIELFANVLAQAIDRIGAPARIFGYSMGGYIAMHLAMQRPHLVRRILTLGTKLWWSSDVALHETQRLQPDTILAKVPAYADDLMRRHGSDRWTTVLDKTAKLMTGLGEQPLLTPVSATSIPVPVRLCIGDRDRMVSVEETEVIARAIPRGELVVMPDTQHPIERVDIEQLMLHITTWLDCDDEA